MAQLIHNPETDEYRYKARDGSWKPARRAVNPSTNEEIIYDGEMWRPAKAKPAPPPPQEMAVPTEFPQDGPGFVPQQTPRPPTVPEQVAKYATGGRYALGEGLTLGRQGEIFANIDTALNNKTYEENLAQRDRELAAVPPVMRSTGETIGAMAVTGPMGGLRSTVARSAFPAGLYGYNTAQGTPMERLPEALLSAGLGYGVDKFASGIARGLSPQVRPNMETIRQMDVPTTPGQTMGGTMRRIEEGLKSTPILGDAIQRGERVAREGMNIGVANRALAPAGITIPAGTEAGEDLVNTVLRQFDEAYSRAIPITTRVRYTQGMADEMSDIIADAGEVLDDSQLDLLRRRISVITQPGRSGGTGMTGRDAQQILSDLKSDARTMLGSAMGSERQYGRVLQDIENVFARQLEASVPDAEFLRNVNRAYRNWLPVENSAARLGAEEGVFTGKQLRGEVRRADQRLRKRGFSTGTAPMKQEAVAAADVIDARVPDSGTSFRTNVTGGLLGSGVGTGGLLAAGGVIDPSTAAMIAGGVGAALLPTLAYTRPGSAAVRAILSGRQGPNYRSISDLVRRYAQPAGMGAAVTGANAIRDSGIDPVSLPSATLRAIVK